MLIHVGYIYTFICLCILYISLFNCNDYCFLNFFCLSSVILQFLACCYSENILLVLLAFLSYISFTSIRFFFLNISVCFLYLLPRCRFFQDPDKHYVFLFSWMRMTLFAILPGSIFVLPELF